MLVFKSRTFYTFVAMFVVGGGNALVPVLPAEYQAIVLAVLGLLGTFFHINPSQTYGKSRLID